ncbi:hypothetical protein, partial [Mediterraneibacter gnavus]|uniref:hypothetical protein n=1 Tax=Mediterraneibacter gnavus TaxID=33038 RepID=UPI0034A1BF7E
MICISWLTISFSKNFIISSSAIVCQSTRRYLKGKTPHLQSFSRLKIKFVNEGFSIFIRSSAYTAVR